MPRRVENLLNPRGSRMVPMPSHQIYFPAPITFTFHVMTTKVEHFMPIVPICIKIGSIICLQPVQTGRNIKASIKFLSARLLCAHLFTESTGNLHFQCISYCHHNKSTKVNNSRQPQALPTSQVQDTIQLQPFAHTANILKYVSCQHHVTDNLEEI